MNTPVALKLIKFDYWEPVEEAINEHVLNSFRQHGELPVVHLNQHQMHSFLRRNPWGNMRTPVCGGGPEPVHVFFYSMAGMVKVMESPDVPNTPMQDTFGLEES